MPPPDRSCFQALNIPSNTIPEYMGSFHLSAPPNTDLWRKPPSRDTSTAPILYTSLRYPFVSAEVTVSAQWKFEWDQAGLCIFAGTPPGRIPPAAAITTISADGTATTIPPPYTLPVASKWVKIGLEFTNNACHAASVVATADGADWAVTPLPPYQAHCSDLRIKLERIGWALWIYFEDRQLGWKKLREVTYFFFGVEDKSVRVGVYASRPANFNVSQYDRTHGIGQTNLRVDFEDLQIY